MIDPHVPRPAVLARLRLGRERVARGWCQGFEATDVFGRMTSPDGPGAIKWCAVGAVYTDAWKWNLSAYEDGAIEALRDAAGAGDLGLSVWNDTPGRTQAEVVEAFDRAIAAEEGTC